MNECMYVCLYVSLYVSLYVCMHVPLYDMVLKTKKCSEKSRYTQTRAPLQGNYSGMKILQNFVVSFWTFHIVSARALMKVPLI